MNILIIRTFVKIRELLSNNSDLAARVEKLEASQREHASVLSLLANEIDKLTETPVDPMKEPIGFRLSDEK